MADEGATGDGGNTGGGESGTDTNDRSNQSTDSGRTRDSGSNDRSTSNGGSNAARTDDGQAALVALAEQYGGIDKLTERLNHARTWEQRARDNRDAAQQLPEVQKQLDEFQKQLSERDTRDIERAGTAALRTLRAAIAERGLTPDDVAALLPDPIKLLSNGDPDDKKIGEIADALAKVAGRPAPDRDQGRKGGEAPGDMNALIRKAAGRA